MRKLLHLFQVIGILLMALPIFFLPPRAASASSGIYLPLVLKSYGALPPLTVKNNCSLPFGCSNIRNMLPILP